MDKISLYIKTVSLVSILAGVMAALIPGGRVKSAYVSLCAVVLICSLIIPLTELKTDKDSLTFSLKQDISESIAHEVDKAEELIYRTTVSQSIAKKLYADGIDVSVEVITSGTAEDLNVTEVIVIGSVSEEEKIYISDFISDSFAKAVTVFKEDEND